MQYLSLIHICIRIVTDWNTWMYILGLALPATAISNMALIKAIKHIGPTPVSYTHLIPSCCRISGSKISGTIRI